MSVSNQTLNIRSLPLDTLVFSQTRAQVERRAHFDKAALQELSETIKAVGRPEQLITVRPSPFREAGEEKYEVADGERRCIASRMAGLTEILCDIRDLSDDQVLDIQIVTGLQKEGLHELVEAEGYEVLTKRGLTADEIAAKVGKSKAYVYARLKLLALDPASRQAFYRGELSASIALLIARIPVASLQRQALGEITQPKYGEPMSYREALDHIQSDYMLRLEDAPFPTDRADLVRNVGPCGSCPKRTGNQPQLFEDVKGADVCTDPTCFKAKREAWGNQQLADAKAKGVQVISGADAKKVKPHEHSDHLAAGYARLEDKCFDDPRYRTYKQILGKDARISLLKVPKTGDVIQVVQRADAVKKLKADGVIKPVKSSAPTATTESKVEREKEKRLQDLLFAEIHKRAPKKLPRVTLTKLIEDALDLAMIQPPDAFYRAWGWDDDTFGDLDKLTEPQLHQLLWEIRVIEELRDGRETEKLENLAKSLKIDVKVIRTWAAAEEKGATPAPAKASKKKAPRK